MIPLMKFPGLFVVIRAWQLGLEVCQNGGYPRLVVDETYERQGFGRFLVLAAIGLVLSVSGMIGCRYLTVDSRGESMSFYERVGF